MSPENEQNLTPAPDPNPNPNPNPSPEPNPASNLNPNPNPSPDQIPGSTPVSNPAPIPNFDPTLGIPDNNNNKPRKIKKKWLIGGIIGGAVVLVGIIIAILFACGVPQKLFIKDYIDPAEVELVGDTKAFSWWQYLIFFDYDNHWKEAQIKQDGGGTINGLVYQDDRAALLPLKAGMLADYVSKDDFRTKEESRRELYDTVNEKFSRAYTIDPITNFRELNEGAYYAALDYKNDNVCGRFFIVVLPANGLMAIFSTQFQTQNDDRNYISEVNRAALATLKSIKSNMYIENDQNTSGQGLKSSDEEFEEQLAQEWKKASSLREEKHFSLDTEQDIHGTWLLGSGKRYVFEDDEFKILAQNGHVESHGEFRVIGSRDDQAKKPKYITMTPHSDGEDSADISYRLIIVDHGDDGLEMQFNRFMQRNEHVGYVLNEGHSSIKIKT